MRILCAPLDRHAELSTSGIAADLDVVLYSRADQDTRGSAGASIIRAVDKEQLCPEPRAWDLLSIALSVIAADISARRDQSPDGWTREIAIRIAVSEPEFWSEQASLLVEQLQFLSTDRWGVEFTGGGVRPNPPAEPSTPVKSCVALFSGGLDSLIGALDLVAGEEQPYLVSQVAHGDKKTQAELASAIDGGLSHLQLNHTANSPGANELSQRARSIIFLAYGVLVASALRRYQDDDYVPLYVCENGFIAINPPLTSGRLGALSTRTAHPAFLRPFQTLLDRAGLRVRLENPYEFQTKGEMLSQCKDQDFIKQQAHTTTSCGRYARSGYRHCGRCFPCLIRRGAFLAWGEQDRTGYVYDDLSKDDTDHARFDDVRSAAIAVLEIRDNGLDRWLGDAVSSARLPDPASYREVVRRGMEELKALLESVGVL